MSRENAATDLWVSICTVLIVGLIFLLRLAMRSNQDEIVDRLERIEQKIEVLTDD